MGDADNTYDFLEIPKLLAPFKNGADFVIGSRFKGTIHKGSMDGLHRYIGNPVLTGCSTSFSIPIILIPIVDFAQSPAKHSDRLPLTTGGMEFASEMLVMASKERLHIEEVPISYYPRQTPSKLHSFADGWRHIRFVLLMKPLPFIAVPGFLFTLIGILLMVFFSINGDIESSHLHTFILGAILVIGGIQVVSSQDS